MLREVISHWILLVALSLGAMIGCSQSEESGGGIVPAGEYGRAITEFEQQEPVRTYLTIRDLLAKGEIEAASKMTSQPAGFVEAMTGYQQRIGEEAFRQNHLSVRQGLSLHSVHHDDDQSLLVLETEQFKLAAFFQKTQAGFIEIEARGPIKVKTSLTNKFRAVKEGQ